MMVGLFRKLGFGILAVLMVMTAAGLWADDDADAVLKEVAGNLLDGSRTEALARLEEVLDKFAGTPAAERLEEARDMIRLLDEVDKFALEDLGKRVGEKVSATIRGKRQTVEIVRVDSAAAIRVARRDGPVVFQENISLDAISPADRLSLLRGMPDGGRALHVALIAWKSRRMKPFSRFASTTGPLASHLQEIASQRVENEKQEAASRRESERLEREKQARERAMTRVAGTRDKVWEDFVENKVTRIKCDITDQTAARLNVQTVGFHYDLYIPSGYNDNPDRWYPLMFIASPGGNASMGVMAERLKNDGYVVVMLVESKNSCPLWANNFLAAHDDVVARVRVAPGAKFGTGMSGGARVSSDWPAMRPGFRGIILQAAAMAYGFKDDKYGEKFIRNYTPNVAVAMTAGDKDSNARETYKLRMLLDSNVPLRIDMFAGGHTWCPGEVFERVMNWQEEVNFLSPPRATEVYKSPYIKVEPEEMHPIAYKWFFMTTYRRALAAKDAYRKYYQLCRLPVIAANGNIDKDPEVSEILAKTSREIGELRKNPELVKNLPVEKAFEDFNVKYSDFEKLAAKMVGNPIYSNYKHKYSRKETTAARDAIAVGQAILEKYPDTPQASFLRGFLPGIEIELSLGQ